VQELSRRHALGYSAAGLALLGEAAHAAAPPAAKAMWSGKNCLVLGVESALSRTIGQTLKNFGANVTAISPVEMTEAVWSKALQPAKADFIVNIAIPERNGAVGTVSLPDFRRVIEASYGRTFLAHKYGVPLLHASGGGGIVTVTSSDGLNGIANAAASCAAVNGIMIMVKSIALDCASKQDNVRVNALLIGDLVDGKAPTAPGQVTAEDVASAVAYLGADASVYLTGMIMPVHNGGRAL
jgi:NAD(P)-dependent dehydrogenase (short-subunit alcohol dehydrogenase family)